MIRPVLRDWQGRLGDIVTTRGHRGNNAGRYRMLAAPPDRREGKMLSTRAGPLYNRGGEGVCQSVDLATETRWCRQTDWQALFQAFSS